MKDDAAGEPHLEAQRYVADPVLERYRLLLGAKDPILLSETRLSSGPVKL